ncbi:MAG: hydrogenase subunit MbhD domain-containing protein [Spirochaetota bacterium]|nr:hydrogenase subunit MbhD domain-containing protein [Spirochaetota bacterium]
MVWELNVIFLLFAAIVAVASIIIKDLLGAVVLMGAFSLFMCLVWTQMGSVDVAFTEATVGAGVSTAFFIVAVYNTTRRSKD